MKYIAKFQNGKRIDYYKEYINSPKFKERIFNAQKASYPTIKDDGIISKLTQRSINESNNAINTVNIFPVDPKDKVNVNKFINGIYGSYSPMAHTVFHKKTDKPIIDEVIVHELSHASSLGNKLIPPYTQDNIPKLTGQSKNSYYGDPTEIKARVDALRYYAKQRGLYDAGKEDFTKVHLDKILKDPFMNKQYFMKEIKEKYLKNPENFIKVMNTLASNKTDNNILKAQEGNKLIPKTPEASFDDEVILAAPTISAVPAVPAVSKKLNNKKSETFSKAFGNARRKGEKIFTWTNPRTGKTGTYGTQLKEEVSVKKEVPDVKKPFYAFHTRSHIPVNHIEKEQITAKAAKAAKPINNSVVKPIVNKPVNPTVVNPSPLADVVKNVSAPTKSVISSIPSNTKPSIASVGEKQVQIPYDVVEQQTKWKNDPKWKSYSGDKYYIFSKQSGRMYIFNKDHSLKYEGPWLRGKTLGDVNTRNAPVTPAGTGVFGKKTVSPDYPGDYWRLLFNTKTTKADASIPEAKNQKLMSTGQSMHLLYNGAKEDRKTIFANDNIPDKTMSGGCVNVGGDIICNPEMWPNYGIDSFAITKEPQRPMMTQDNYKLMSDDQKTQIAKLLYSYQGRPGTTQALKYKMKDK